MRSKDILLWTALAAGLLTAGCSTVENSHRQKSGMMQDYLAGRNGRVMEKIADELEEPSIWNASTVGTGDELMWRLEAGAMNFNTGNFRGSIDQFTRAEALIAEYDSRAVVSLRDTAAEGAMSVTNLNALPYRGFCRDRIMLSFYKSLAYLGTGDSAAFRAQLKRLRAEQKNALGTFRASIEEETEALKADRKRNPSGAKKADAAAKDPASVSGNEAFAKGLAEVRENAKRGYADFLNPAALFLSGLGSLRDGNYDNARIDFERLSGALPENVLIRRMYAEVLRKTGRPLPAGLESEKPFPHPVERNCVYVIVASGRSAALRQIAVYVPVMTAWPMCEFYPSPFETVRVEADGTVREAEKLSDMDAVFAREFDERLSAIVTRIVLSTLIKEAAYYGGLTAVSVTRMDPTARIIALCAIAIGGAAYRAAVNTADTRSWEILPKEFHLALVPVPADGKVSVDFGGGVRRTAVLPSGTESAVVFVNAPSAENLSVSVLSFESKQEVSGK